MKAGTWKQPLLLFAQPVGYRHPRWTKPHAGPYVLQYQPHFDPMMYFWPVENFCLIVRTDNLESEHTLRIVRAALRDGAEIVATNVATMLTSDSKFYDQENGWKKPTNETTYTVQPPSKKQRYRATLDAIRDAERNA